MEILLIKPKAVLGPVLGLEAFQRLEPIELGYLAAAVPDDHRVRVLDLRLTWRPWKAVDRALTAAPPDLVGITGYTHESSAVKEIALRVRQRAPGATIVVGGHHATVAPDDYDQPFIDAIVRGEGCRAFAEVVTRVAGGAPVDGIPHVLLTGDGFDADAARAWPQFPEPATLPVPRRDLWDPGAYRAVWVTENAAAFQPLFPPVSLVRSSWGCRMKCTFCVVPHLCGGEHRPRPADLVAEEIGLDAAFLGFEYADDRDLKRVHKGGSVAANERALDTLRRLGIAVHAAFMVEPEFTDAEFDGLAAYVRAMPPAQCSFTVRTPSPGTPDYAEMRPRMWVERPYELHDCMHPLVPTALPLKRFAARLARQGKDGAAKTPLRSQHRPLRPVDLVRVQRAQRRYYVGYRDLCRDYPTELWDARPPVDAVAVREASP